MLLPAEQGIAGALFDLGSTQQEQAARARGVGMSPGQGAMPPPPARAPPVQVNAMAPRAWSIAFSYMRAWYLPAKGKLTCHTML